MPNTLCHIGIQGPLSRFFGKAGHPLLPVIGCILPDLPWIVYKLLVPLSLFDPYRLRLYCMAQASLLFCLVLSGALAALMRAWLPAFLLIGANCAAHLLLDILQIKWGNGVHFLAPFSWQMTQLHLFWPEHPTTLLATLIGGGYLLQGIRNLSAPLLLDRTTAGNLCFALLLGIYLLAPLPFLEEMERLDNYYIHTLSNRQERGGKAIEFDRAHYFADTGQLRSFSGEYLQVQGNRPDRSGRVSFRGHFLTSDTVFAEEFHFHRDDRDLASVLGLIMACTLFIQSVLVPQIRNRHSRRKNQ